MEELIYNILAYVIIAFAVFIAVRKIFFKPVVQKSDCSSGCGGCSSKCDLKQLVDTQKANR